MSKLLGSIKSVFEAVAPAELHIAARTMPLSEIEEAWKAPGKPHIVIAIH
jgi:hypothetical protein